MFAKAYSNVELYNLLNKQNNNLWLNVTGEMHGGGRELITWFLVADADNIPDVYRIFCETAAPMRALYDETKFYVSFQQVSGNDLIYWVGFEDDELISPEIPVDWNTYPQRNPISDSDIRTFPLLKGII